MTLRTLGQAVLGCVLVLLPASAHAQMSSAELTKIVRDTSWNEINSRDPNPYRYVVYRDDAQKGELKKEVIETRNDGEVTRLIEVNGKPLTPSRAAQETNRLNTLLNDPDLQAKRHRDAQKNGQRDVKMVALLPDAFLFKEIGVAQTESGPVLKLSFEPNPNFHPPDREAMVYHGMEGELWINQEHKRIVKMDAHLIADVEFGWGILGTLYKGGSFMVERKNVGNNHWEETFLKVNMTGKALMVHDLVFKMTEKQYDFQPVPNTWTYKDAIRALLSGPATAPAPPSGN
jgi:hypothetical protein